MARVGTMPTVPAEKGIIGVIMIDVPVRPADFFEVGLYNVETIILERFFPFFGYFKKMFDHRFDCRSTMTQSLAVFLGRKGTTIVMKAYPTRNIITVTLEYDQLEYEGKTVISLDMLKVIESDLAEIFRLPDKPSVIPEITRGLNRNLYFITSDNRAVEYDIQELLFDKKTKYQRVQIVKTGNFGNMLILDNNVNLADTDLIYTETIMSRGNINYEGKEILILGGGDGALLNELRKESAASITMVEIDEVVMNACKKFMRKGCGDALDSYNHENYEILVGDCVEFMEACQADGKKFDFIFGDLTEIPISSTPKGEIWDFLKKILNLAMSILKEDGMYLTHGNGAAVPKSLEMYEQDVLEKLDVPVKFSKTGAYIPSFKEEWIFYRIEKGVVN